ncbi:polysaccharide deacetylase [Streptomyces albidoflavus]|uniref:polysaccharide deacetylase family protein n=1 Tax=Streptomyces albidoflavus TaxID=1886 RepID=UPI000BADDCC7|nr:polysaccharide deacetylase family protein [Streptomyces albidoflavus]PAX83551.1 polysaccharide deacetylase [Streptomyces albidoflavus]PAX87553.1 polysaccharide deacetylase [Streptomyces albidoflavus]PBO17031.1 polysaccharide deacetylase [Streptomyces albidoflavus]PBO21915.1 polysaccharide deacetylase [Streptomyces albidoflavus]PBO28146.1 polysaccharide deacetylase [Streptomyces albidoflavus]
MVRKAKLRTGTALGALMALGAAAGCGQSVPDPHDTAPGPRASHSASPAAPTAPPTLAPGPGGLAPVFANGPRNDGKTVALTFDADMTADQGERAAGGERFDHPELIASLRRLKVPATVFMTGRWAEEYPDQARAIGADPLFEIANHSYSHHAFTGDCYGLPRVAESEMRADVERAYTAFRTAGVKKAMPYFRFPGGCYDDAALREVSAAGVTAVQWDVVSGDAFATDADAVAQQVLDGVRPGSVVVMHCTRSAAPTTERALRRIVPALREQGYHFVKVSELIGAASRKG